MPSGQPLNTLEKQAPMCTLGVGGRPLLVNLGEGGVLLLRSRRRGGRDGAEASVSETEEFGTDPAPLSSGKTPKNDENNDVTTEDQ